jgi:hypothetical protein
MVFLHLSLTPLTEYRDGTGVYANGRPKGLWYGHDLSWVSVMESKKSWNPNLTTLASPLPAPIVPLYAHVLGEKRLSPPQEGESLAAPPTLQMHYAYVFPLESAFVDGGKPSKTKVLRITADTYGRLLEGLRPIREAWYRDQGNKFIATGHSKPYYYIIRDKSGPEYQATLAHLKLKKATESNLTHDHVNAIVEGILSGAIPIGNHLRSVEVEFWRFFTPTLQELWGGLDVDASLFAHAPAKLFVETLAWDAPSGVLFHPTQVLKGAPASHLKAIVRWGPREEAPPDGPVYTFGLTTTGEVRVLSEPSPSGGRRRRTRRRVLKNPKTLKKRIR